MTERKNEIGDTSQFLSHLIVILAPCRKALELDIFKNFFRRVECDGEVR